MLVVIAWALPALSVSEERAPPEVRQQAEWARQAGIVLGSFVTVAHEGGIALRPMMYLALSYDHRIIDGREAVGFLKTIKELVEAPERVLLEV